MPAARLEELPGEAQTCKTQSDQGQRTRSRNTNDLSGDVEAQVASIGQGGQPECMGNGVRLGDKVHEFGVGESVARGDIQLGQQGGSRHKDRGVEGRILDSRGVQHGRRQPLVTFWLEIVSSDVHDDGVIERADAVEVDGAVDQVGEGVGAEVIADRALDRAGGIVGAEDRGVRRGDGGLARRAEHDLAGDTLGLVYEQLGAATDQVLDGDTDERRRRGSSDGKSQKDKELFHGVRSLYNCGLNQAVVRNMQSACHSLKSKS